MRAFKLWPDQQLVYSQAVGMREIALFCEQRTGKTYITLALLKKWAGAPLQQNDFVGVMATLLTNRDSTWLAALNQFIPWLEVTSDWEEFKKLSPPKLLLINHEMVPRLIKKLVKYKKISFFGIDEGHRLSNHSTALGRSIARMGWVDRKLVLTGTPFERDPLGLFGMFKFLDPELFGGNHGNFKARWADIPQFECKAPAGTPLWSEMLIRHRMATKKAPFNEELLPEFMELIGPYCLKMVKEDVGIRRAKIHRVGIPVTRSTQGAISQLRRTGVVDLAGQEPVTASLAITSLVKERQLASGFLFSDDGEQCHLFMDPKIEWILKHIRRLKLPLVIFSEFVPPIIRLESRLRAKGYEVATLYGKTKKKKRRQVIEAFQRAEYDVIICQNRTGGVGVDLWRSTNAVVHSLGHSSVDWDQLISRLDKPGRAPAEFFVLCSKNTVDEKIHDLVVVKGLNRDRVVSQLSRGRKTSRMSKNNR